MSKPEFGPKSYGPGERSRVRRRAERASYDREDVHAVLDAGHVVHVGMVMDDHPFVLPMAYVRVDETVYLHGSRGSRLMRNLAKGEPVSLTVTLVDGLVLARSAFHHSMNYRCVSVFGCGRAVEEDTEKTRVLMAMVEGLCPGRAGDTRVPNEAELAATLLVGVAIDEASVKRRSGPAVDDESDYSLDHWAGVVRLNTAPVAVEADSRMPSGTPLPGYLSRFVGS
ncbi:MAG: nitroimidazol reductase NimA-like FMN-containing flavoprotein [Hyphomicrobiaceae bacterium]|jgi:nitroimidazol reductase NimA-like FMN-containing flavoprotein (pyridoxamine 5'-phosphate oxidase superfamily)